MCKCRARACDRCVCPRARKAARLFCVVVAGFHHLRKCLFHIVFFSYYQLFNSQGVTPFASRTRICIYVRRKSWQRYNYFAYVVDILLIKLYLREGQGVTGEKMCFVATSVFHEVPFIRNPRVSLRLACFTRFRLAS